MDSKNIIRDALSLSPAERLFIIETLSKSLSEPNKEIEEDWKDEVEKRYEAFISLMKKFWKINESRILWTSVHRISRSDRFL